MCYSAIPGQNGILAIRDIASVRSMNQSQPAIKATRPIIFLCSVTTPIFSGLRVPISHERIPHAWSRRNHRTDNERGKRTAKRMHKPCWRGYEKF